MKTEDETRERLKQAEEAYAHLVGRINEIPKGKECLPAILEADISLLNWILE